MSYNQGYGQQAQQGYGSYNPYAGESGNPYGRPQQSGSYGQQEQPYGHQGNYSERPDFEHHSSSRYDEESAQGGSYEMSSMNSSDPNRILNEVRAVDDSLNHLDQEIENLRMLQSRFLTTADVKAQTSLSKDMDGKSQETTQAFAALKDRMKRIRTDPEAQNQRNRAQVNKVNRRLKETFEQKQRLDLEFKGEANEQFRRDFRIVRPDASEDEIREAMENSSNQQVYSMVLASANRRGEANTIAQSVQNRHAAIQKIESDMIKLAQMYNDLATLVVQQEPAVTQIEEKGMEATGHVAQANTELDGAVKKARSARKKKFICLGIVVLICIIIAVAVGVGVGVTRASSGR